MKKPKWLGWESSETTSDDLKKVRRQTDQRMNQQDVQKAQRDEAEKKNRSPSAPPETARRGRAINSRRRTGRWPDAIGTRPEPGVENSATYTAFRRRPLPAIQS